MRSIINQIIEDFGPEFLSKDNEYGRKFRKDAKQFIGPGIKYPKTIVVLENIERYIPDDGKADNKQYIVYLKEIKNNKLIDEIKELQLGVDRLGKLLAPIIDYGLVFDASNPDLFKGLVLEVTTKSFISRDSDGNIAGDRTYYNTYKFLPGLRDLNSSEEIARRYNEKGNIPSDTTKQSKLTEDDKRDQLRKQMEMEKNEAV